MLNDYGHPRQCCSICHVSPTGYPPVRWLYTPVQPCAEWDRHGYSNVRSVLIDLKARLQMTLCYGGTSVFLCIAEQSMANLLRLRKPAHALSELDRSGPAAVHSEKPTAPRATATASDLRSTVQRRSGIQTAALSSVCLLSGRQRIWCDFDLEHPPNVEIYIKRACPSLDRYNTASKRDVRPRDAVEQTRDHCRIRGR